MRRQRAQREVTVITKALVTGISFGLDGFGIEGRVVERETHLETIGRKASRRSTGRKRFMSFHDYAQANPLDGTRNRKLGVAPRAGLPEGLWNIEELTVACHHPVIRDPTWAAIGNDDWHVHDLAEMGSK